MKTRMNILIGLGVAFVALIAMVVVLPGSEIETDTAVDSVAISTMAPMVEPAPAPTVAPAPAVVDAECYLTSSCPIQNGWTLAEWELLATVGLELFPEYDPEFIGCMSDVIMLTMTPIEWEYSSDAELEELGSLLFYECSPLLDFPTY